VHYRQVGLDMTGSIACTVIYSPMKKDQREIDFPWETSALNQGLDI